jgi:hypothetical protein
MVIGVRVDIHEARGKREAGRLDHPMPQGWSDSPDLCDPVTCDGKVGASRGGSGPVDEVSPSNH